MKITRRTALQTCSAASASAVLTAGGATSEAAAKSDSELVRVLEAAIRQCDELKAGSRNSATISAQWNLLATHASNCQRIASVIVSQLKSGNEASPANIQACADACSRLIMTTHVLATDDAKSAVNCLAECKDACLHWLAMKLA